MNNAEKAAFAVQTTDQRIAEDLREAGPQRPPAPLRPDYDADDYTSEQLREAITFLSEGLATRD